MFPAVPLGSTIFVCEIFAYVTFSSNHRGSHIPFSWMVWLLGVFLLPAFTHLGHECQDLLSLCDRMHVCTDWTSRKWSQNPQEKSLLPDSSEQGRTHNAAWHRIASQTHYQLSYFSPSSLNNSHVTQRYYLEQTQNFQKHIKLYLDPMRTSWKKEHRSAGFLITSAEGLRFIVMCCLKPYQVWKKLVHKTVSPYWWHFLSNHLSKVSPLNTNQA